MFIKINYIYKTIYICTKSTSSAYIELIFSICGIIFTRRNSKDDLFHAGSMMSRNFKLV
jgi:hypothetical protein